ncbi:MAG: hypothetical protein SWH68_02955, partial [Thermodesulfobacteriota bacterium]|nr:hypothetical protein [Thermodesulfobacteriota bacterium]
PILAHDAPCSYRAYNKNCNKAFKSPRLQINAVPTLLNDTKILKRGKKQPRSKKFVSKTCVIMSSFK